MGWEREASPTGREGEAGTEEHDCGRSFFIPFVECASPPPTVEGRGGGGGGEATAVGEEDQAVEEGAGEKSLDHCLTPRRTAEHGKDEEEEEESGRRGEMVKVGRPKQQHTACTATNVQERRCGDGGDGEEVVVEEVVEEVHDDKLVHAWESTSYKSSKDVNVSSTSSAKGGSPSVDIPPSTSLSEEEKKESDATL